jgi:hypothetical protein
LEFAFNDTVDPVRGISPFMIDTSGTPHTPVSLLVRAFRKEKGLSTSIQGTAEHLLDRYSEISQDIREKLTNIGLARRRDLATRGYIPYDFKEGDKVMLENPKAGGRPNTWKKLSALEDRYIGPFTLGKETGPNRFVIKEWENSTGIKPHHVVNASKFKPVGPGLLEDAQALQNQRPDTPLETAPQPQQEDSQLRLEDANVDKQAPLEQTAPMVHSLKVVKTLENAEPTDPNKFSFDRYSFGIKIIIKPDASDTLLETTLEDEYKIGGRFFTLINEWLDNNQDRVAQIQTTARQLANNEINRIQTQRKYSHSAARKIINKTTACLLDRVVSKSIQEISLGICDIWDPVDYSCPYRILWSDGDSGDMTPSELAKQTKYVVTTDYVHLASIDELPDGLNNLENTNKAIEFLNALMPGVWTKGHASRLCNRQIGSYKFNPQFIPTEKAETLALLSCLNIDYFKDKKGLDPFCGSGSIATVFGDNGIINVRGNDINPMLKECHQENALTVEPFKRWSKTYDFAVCSPPFDMLDVALPLLARSFPVSLVHVPPWYITNTPDSRHKWLSALAQEGLCVGLNNTYHRNTQLNRYCMWLVLVRDSELMSKVLNIDRTFHLLPLYI